MNNNCFYNESQTLQVGKKLAVFCIKVTDTVSFRKDFRIFFNVLNPDFSLSFHLRGKGQGV